MLTESDLHNGFPVERGKLVPANAEFFARTSGFMVRHDQPRPKGPIGVISENRPNVPGLLTANGGSAHLLTFTLT
jgi:hypothetical protein